MNEPSNRKRAAAVADTAPCSVSCAKCGCDDIYRRFYGVGKYTNGSFPKRDRRSTEWVDRSDPWMQPAIKDCIVHICRCCGYQWDSDPLPNAAYNDECHVFFERQYAAMNLDDKTDFTRFEAMATVETFLHSIGVMGKLNGADQQQPPK